ncbi:FAD-dependent oxidoreductase [Spongiactinospora sp. TRM90649]|uniref:NAD(P)/FAD-dependent oxidoreductase n=1 Tax=Spongiactinospora sp. TRM90649 TaxID=3031114 RepID=UPI0023F96745|nr:FAD-dependent oxidoreductase [Spongiactinospora sp. TRM90649]MDF5755115.1 FAD-dependent oxidoreductase [Spongiactinospora sp. TRM90649]
MIVGGGFAGVWSAAAAARVRGDADLRVTLIAPHDDMVLRPRLHRLDPEWARVPLKRILEPIGVTQVKEEVTGIDVADSTVTAGGRTIRYDRLVLAAGSRLVSAALPGARHMFDIDTTDGVARLNAHLGDRTGFTAVVIGSGFTGLEIATELAARGRVILLERAGVVAPELGPGPRPVIEAALADLGIDVRLGVDVRSVTEQGLVLADGASVPADAVVWTAGMRAHPLTEQIPADRDGLGRLHADRHLRVSDQVFAAGDVAAALADATNQVVQSCQFATPMGKAAGHNAAADLLGLPLVEFTPDPYVTCLDLGAAGAVFTTGWDRTVALTGDQAKDLKQTILEVIHPPVDDAAEILRQSAQQSNEVAG